MLKFFKFLKILKFFNIMQFKQKHNGIEYNVTFFASDKKKSIPSRRSRNYLSNEGSPNSVSFTVSEIKQKK